MLDAAKYADLVLLLIDAAFGFEMETFEFLNLLQVGARRSWVSGQGPPRGTHTLRACPAGRLPVVSTAGA